MRRTAVFALMLLLGFSLAADRAAAQPHFGAYAGYNADNEELFLGLTGQFHLENTPFILSPEIESYFIDELTLLQINGNALVKIGQEYATTFVPYAGAGLGILYRSFDDNIAVEDDTDVDLGLNLIGGAYFLPLARFHPFVQARITLADDGHVAALGGVMISL